jgi:antitoxin (DNA-binding transcriptional repressor) of toxin-antitoxin stability system
MKTHSIASAARNFDTLLQSVESSREEVVIVRRRRPIARLIPEPQAQTALEVFSDLAGTLDDDTADSLQSAINASRRRKNGTLRELRRPWDS